MDDTGTPRLKSALWVSAYLRRCAAAGAHAALSRRGDESAGALFLECLHDNGVDLYGPLPGGGGRRFEQILSGATGLDVAERLSREARFDADFWLVTVEDRNGQHFLTADEYG